MIYIQSYNNYFNLVENVYIPRIKLKKENIFEDVPQNQWLDYNENIFIKAIEYGMILTIKYKGAKDNNPDGHIRTIYPMVIGDSRKGKPLLRAWHFKGFSVSLKGETEKIWRLFRTDRILKYKFEGIFYRTTPDGYIEDDSGFGRITKSADLNEIIRNQDELLKTKEIQSVEDINITKKWNNQVRIQTTNTELNLENPFANQYLEQNKNNKSTINILIAEGEKTKKLYPIFGVVGDDGKIITIKDNSGNIIETAKILFNVNGTNIHKLKKIKGATKFNLYLGILQK